METSEDFQACYDELPPLDEDFTFPSESTDSNSNSALQTSTPFLGDEEFALMRLGDPIPDPVSTNCVFRVQRVPAAVHEECISAEPLQRREIKRGNNPLPRFRKLNSKAPKHEYYLAMLIRAHKKSIRLAANQKSILPKGGVFKEFEEVQMWKNYINFVGNCGKEVVTLAQTESGPATDGKSHRDSDEDVEIRSFNKLFIHRYLAPPKMREILYYFVEMLFAAEPEVMCKRMKFKCCREETHTKKCRDLWMDLKTYTQNGMVSEVGWKPFTPK